MALGTNWEMHEKTTHTRFNRPCPDSNRTTSCGVPPILRIVCKCVNQDTTSRIRTSNLDSAFGDSPYRQTTQEHSKGVHISCSLIPKIFCNQRLLPQHQEHLIHLLPCRHRRRKQIFRSQEGYIRRGRLGVCVHLSIDGRFCRAVGC